VESGGNADESFVDAVADAEKVTEKVAGEKKRTLTNRRAFVFV
jgi:hypothetical protein|tara:strand:+ start:759 stop:887 length:129 start_codon:yes stop_codon:yes gene_type:complete